MRRDVRADRSTICALVIAVTALLIACATPRTLAQRVDERTLTVSAKGETRQAFRQCLLLPVAQQQAGNAVVVYMQVPNVGPKYEPTLELLTWPRQADAKIDPVAVRAAVEEQNARLTMFAEAASFRTADWPLVVDHLSVNRRISDLLALRARVAVRTGDIDSALRDIQISLAASRHFNDGEQIIQSLVAISMATATLHAVADVMQCSDGPNLYWALQRLPKPLLPMNRSRHAEHQRMVSENEVFVKLESDEPWRDLDAAKVTSVLQSDAPFEQPDWMDDKPKKRLPDTVAENVKAVAKMPQAYRWLLEQGMPEGELKPLSPLTQCLLQEYGRYHSVRDRLYAQIDLPLWQQTDMPKLLEEVGQLSDDAVSAGSKLRLRELSTLRALVATQARFDRSITAMTCVEALRMYAAEHGEFPAALDAEGMKPLPVDPFTGKLLGYTRVSPTEVTLTSDGEAFYPPEWRNTLRWSVHLQPDQAEQE